MPNVFLGNSYDDAPTAQLTKYEVNSFKEFCERFLKTCRIAGKFENYVTIGDCYDITKGDPEASSHSYLSQDHYHRNNKSQVTAWILPFDGDNSKSSHGSCIPAKQVHESLLKLGYSHVVYTTYSHIPNTKNRWRLFIPCRMSDSRQLENNVVRLFDELQAVGCSDLAMATESKTWSVPWFLPTTAENLDNFEYYTYFNGRDFLSLNVQHTSIDTPVSIELSRTAMTIIETIVKGTANTGLHDATRDLSNGLIKDGVSPGYVKAILEGLTYNYDMSNARQKENKSKINDLVDSAAKKNEIVISDEWEEDDSITDRVFTKYPKQGGVMEDIVDTCLKWMPYPNRQIATTAAHALISTLGGRVYTLPTGSGIVLTALITGRSTIGKSFIKKFCIFALNNFLLGNTSHEFIGSHFYTSSKNLVDELKKSGSLLSVRTESGQADKSSAGDMTRVLMYELELATESGRDGYVSSGGQNDKIPAIFSPAVTTIRESVPQIQNEADLANASTISGVAGRRSHILIDSIKPDINLKPIKVLPQHLKDLLHEIYKKAKDERYKIIEKPMDPSMWIEIQYKDPLYLYKKHKEWLELENKAALNSAHFISTFYGRLGERIPAWAARLAICDNPKQPIVTRQHIDIAEASLKAELNAHTSQSTSGELDSDIDQIVVYIVKLFKGNMSKHASFKKCGKKMLKDGACKWNLLMGMVRNTEPYRKASKTHPNLDYTLVQKLTTYNILEMPKDEAKTKYQFRGRVMYKV